MTSTTPSVSMHIMKNKHLFVAIAVLILIAVVFFGRSLVGVPQQTTIHGGASVESILSDIFSHVDPILEPRREVSQTSFWQTPDGYLVAVETKRNVSGHLKGLGNDPKTLSVVDSINTYAIQTLEKAGYEVDSINSSTSTDSSPFFLVRHAYVSSDGVSRCVITPPVSIYTWSIDCVDTQDIETAYESEKPFLNIFENQKDIALIPKVQGEFASIKATDGSAGYYAILKKDHDTWRVIFRGQQQPSCVLMKENNVPQSLYQSCN